MLGTSSSCLAGLQNATGARCCEGEDTYNMGCVQSQNRGLNLSQARISNTVCFTPRLFATRKQTGRIPCLFSCTFLIRMSNTILVYHCSSWVLQYVYVGGLRVFRTASEFLHTGIDVFKTSRASPCRDRAPDSNSPNFNPHPYPDCWGLETPMRSNELAIPPRNTVLYGYTYERPYISS